MIYCENGRFHVHQLMLSSLKRNAGRFRVMLITVSICSLTFSLATRFSVASATEFHTAKSFDSRSAEPKRQNLDRETSRFVRPVPISEPFTPALVSLRVVESEPLSSSRVCSLSLYNRPPPAVS
jgi:hypothetical protein